MANVLSNIANNFSEEIHRNKSKFRHNDKKCKYCDYFLEYKNFKDDLIKC